MEMLFNLINLMFKILVMIGLAIVVYSMIQLVFVFVTAVIYAVFNFLL